MTLLLLLLSVFEVRAAVIGVGPLAAAEPVCVIKPDVDLHAKPDARSKVSWLVGLNMPFLKVGEKRDKRKNLWFQVRDLDNQLHWTRASTVSQKVSCAVVKRDEPVFRTQPAFDAAPAVYPPVYRYTPFRKIDRDGEWVSLEDDYGSQLWAHERDLWIPAKRTGIAF